MALTSEQIDILASSYVSELYTLFESEVINDIVRRVEKTGRYTETAEIMARNLREQGFSAIETQRQVQDKLRQDPAYQKAIAEETKSYKDNVKELIKQMEEKALAEGDLLIANAGTMAWNDDMQMWKMHGVDLKKDNTLSQLQKAFTEQTRGMLQNLTGTTGNIRIGYEGIMDEYRHQMDLATIKVASGAFSYNQAVKDCIKNLAQHGVSVRYPSGKKLNLDVAARMSLRTATSQLAGKITEENLKKTNTPLVYVDAHGGARPEHAMWQGQVYVYDQTKAEKYPQYKDFWSATDYGSVTGLKGVNCSHNFYPYWEDDVIPEYIEPQDVVINGKNYTYYEATQEQRRQERQIRQSRRELDMLSNSTAATPEDIGKAKDKLSKQLQKYRAFSNSAGLRPKPERAGIFPNRAPQPNFAINI